MQHPDAELAARLAAARAGNPVNSAASSAGSAKARPSAIERQMALTAGLGHERIHREEPDQTARRKPRRFGLAGFSLLLLMAAAALVVWVPDPESSLLNVWRSAAGAIREVAAYSNSLLPRSSSLKNSSDSQPAAASALSVDAALAKRVASEKAARPSAEVAQVAAQKHAAEVSAPPVLSIPIADVSLRNRPELLEQLVRTYRAKLAEDPDNAAAWTALNQLQERSLTELQSIILEGDDSTAVKSIEIVSRLFPEAADSVRYQYLAARVERIHRQEQDAAATKSEGSTSPAVAALPEPVSHPKAAASLAKPAPAEKFNSIANNSGAAPAINKTAEHASSSAAEQPLSTKPEIRAVSITPGAMIHDRFVPDVEGNAFLVEVSYRNFDKIAEDQDPVSLVARLGLPGYSNVLAEAPIEILGDRGTKSFVMTTLMPAGEADEYKLNFMLNGQFFASRTVRVSR